MVGQKRPTERLACPSSFASTTQQQCAHIQASSYKKSVRLSTTLDSVCHRGEAVRGGVGIKSRGVTAAGELLHEKKEATHRRGVMSTLFCSCLKGKVRKNRTISCCCSPRSNHDEPGGEMIDGTCNSSIVPASL